MMQDTANSFTIVLRIDLSNTIRIGRGKIALLEAVDQKGSISAAARELGMSYRRAWLLLEETNTAFGRACATTSAGGAKGGGAALTEFGRELIATYRSFEAEVNHLGTERLAALDRFKAE